MGMRCTGYPNVPMIAEMGIWEYKKFLHQGI